LEGPSVNLYLNKLLDLEFISTTQELLYQGTDTDIIINVNYGYYQDIWIICENIEEQINSISLINTDAVLMNNIPTQLILNNTNSVLYCLNVGNDLMSGIKINEENWLNVKLEKKQDAIIKIYGSKLMGLKLKHA
jgi:hypothetical protein